MGHSVCRAATPHVPRADAVVDNEERVRCTFAGMVADDHDDIVRGVADHAVEGDDTVVVNAPQVIYLNGGQLDPDEDHPNLVSINVNLDASWIEYTFDMDVTSGGTATGEFGIYDAAGEAYFAASVVDTLDDDTVRANYFAEELAIAVSTVVVDGAVEETETGGTNPNHPEEVGIALSFDAGESIAPTLVSVTLDFDEEEVVFEFDRDE